MECAYRSDEKLDMVLKCSRPPQGQVPFCNVWRRLVHCMCIIWMADVGALVGSNMSVFDSDPRFCPECGTILPLPTGAKLMSCMNSKCCYQVPESGL